MDYQLTGQPVIVGGPWRRHETWQGIHPNRPEVLTVINCDNLNDSLCFFPILGSLQWLRAWWKADWCSRGQLGRADQRATVDPFLLWSVLDNYNAPLWLIMVWTCLDMFGQRVLELRVLVRWNLLGNSGFECNYSACWSGFPNWLMLFVLFICLYHIQILRMFHCTEAFWGSPAWLFFFCDQGNRVIFDFGNPLPWSYRHFFPSHMGHQMRRSNTKTRHSLGDIMGYSILGGRDSDQAAPYAMARNHGHMLLCAHWHWQGPGGRCFLIHWMNDFEAIL